MQPPIPPPTSESSFRCPRCGVPIQGQPPFCPNCGYALAAAMPSGPRRTGGESAGITVLKVLAALLLIGIALVVGGVGACFAIVMVAAGKPGKDDWKIWCGVAACGLVVVGCIAALIAIFKPPRRR